MDLSIVVEMSSIESLQVKGKSLFVSRTVKQKLEKQVLEFTILITYPVNEFLLDI